MRRHVILLGVVLALAGAWTLWQRGCAGPKPDIETTGGAILVRNQTTDDWLDVRIWVNDYYSGTAAEIKAGSFVREPVSRFIAAQGQTLKTSAAITSVVVLGHTRAGAPVRVALGRPAWH
jgi:hypothetical protein